MTDSQNQTAAFLIDDRLKTNRRLGAGVSLVTQSPNDALGMKEAARKARAESAAAGDMAMSDERQNQTATRPADAELWRRHYWPLPSQGTEGQRNFIRLVQGDALDAALSEIERTWPEADSLLDAIKAMKDQEVE